MKKLVFFYIAQELQLFDSDNFSGIDATKALNVVDRKSEQLINPEKFELEVHTGGGHYDKLFSSDEVALVKGNCILELVFTERTGGVTENFGTSPDNLTFRLFYGGVAVYFSASKVEVVKQPESFIGSLKLFFE